jgi:hypothetical protein
MLYVKDAPGGHNQSIWWLKTEERPKMGSLVGHSKVNRRELKMRSVEQKELNLALEDIVAPLDWVHEQFHGRNCGNSGRVSASHHKFLYDMSGYRRDKLSAFEVAHQRR